MARVEAVTHIEATPERVWAVITDWEGQARWMQDARSVVVLGSRREGTGVHIRCVTDILGMRVVDDMVTTEWEEGRRFGIRHLGRLIRGIGVFELEPTEHGTRFVWWEELQVPFGTLGDALAQTLVVPWVERVFRGSLANLKRVCESSSVRPAAAPPPPNPATA